MDELAAMPSPATAPWSTTPGFPACFRQVTPIDEL